MSSTRKNTITCPPGTIMRKGYTRKFRESITKSGFTVRRKGKMYTVRPKATAVHVPSSCVKDKGAKGKGPQIFGKLRKGDLIKYGYQYRLSDRLRRKALEKAEVAYGALTLFHKLDAISKLSRRTVPDASKIFSQDRDWVSEQYLHKK